MAFQLSITTRLPHARGTPQPLRQGEVVAAASVPSAAAAAAAGQPGPGEVLFIEHRWLALGAAFNGRVQRPQLYPSLGPRHQQPGSMRIVLGDPPEATSRLKNGKEIAAAAAAAPGGCILLLQRGGGSSFVDKAWRALQACPSGVAAIVIGNDDREHPHALFPMRGAWPPRQRPAPTAAAAAAAAATASGTGTGANEAPPVPVLMISYAAHKELLALLRLERDFGSASSAAGAVTASSSSPRQRRQQEQQHESSSLLRLDVRLEPLLPMDGQGPGTPAEQRLRSFELGPAIRQAVRANDHSLLRALLGQVPEAADEEQEQEDGARGAGPLPAYAEAEAHSGSTVLHLAVEVGAVECLGPLLQRRGIVRVLDTPNAQGRRPTHLAAEHNQDLALALLLAAGAYVDAPDAALGWSPLHFAARAGAPDALDVLLRAGASLDYRARDGSTPFVIALHSGQAAVAEALLRAGASPCVPNRAGKRPGDCALASGSKACAALVAQYEQQAVSSGRPVSSSHADLFHWSAAPWLAAHGSGDGSGMLQSTAAESEMEGLSSTVEVQLLGKHEQPPVRVFFFSAGSPCRFLAHASDAATCRAVLPADAFLEALRGEVARWGGQHRGAGEAIPCSEGGGGGWSEDKAGALGRQLRALEELAPDVARAIVRVLGCAARASWAAGVPAVGRRGQLVLVELPARLRRSLWLGALTGQEDGKDGDGEAVGPGAVEEGWVCQGSPVRSCSEAVGERVRCLFEDLRRTRIPQYASGPGMDRVRRLILLWLRRDPAADYRQGLTFLACPILEAFQPQEDGDGDGDRHLGWDPVSDGQALLCLGRVVDLHTDGLFLHGNSLDRLQQRIGLLETLVQYHDPATAAHLAGRGVTGPLYCSRWLIALFADVLPLRRTMALFDALFTAGRGLLPCFAAAVVLQHRDRILATATQTGLLLLFSQLNSGNANAAAPTAAASATAGGPDDHQQEEEGGIDVHACLALALGLYARTPSALLRAWDSDQLEPGAYVRRKSTSVDGPLPPPPLTEPPLVLERPAELSGKDLAELAAAAAETETVAAPITAAAAAVAAAVPGAPTAAGHGPEAPRPPPLPPLGPLLLDVRDLTLEDHRPEEPEHDDGGSGGGGRSCSLPPSLRRLRLPYQTIQGHVAFCRGLADVQREMRPPPALRPHVGKAHIVVYAAGAVDQARAVARMLVLSRVPFVSVFAAPDKAGEGAGAGATAGGGK